MLLEADAVDLVDRLLESLPDEVWNLHALDATACAGLR